MHLASPGEKRDVAIGQDRGAVAVWTMNPASDAVDVTPAHQPRRGEPGEQLLGDVAGRATEQCAPGR